MKITAEISLYPLEKSYDQAILEFLDRLGEKSDISLKTNAMSTLITGDYDIVMEVIAVELKKFMEKHTAVSVLKISNGCLIE